MAASTTITVSADSAKKRQELAEQRRQNIDALLEAPLEDASLQGRANPCNQGGIVEAGDDFAENATPDMQSYLALHPMLRKKYLGQFVAIYQGKVVDHDSSHQALYRRIPVPVRWLTCTPSPCK